MPSISRFLGIIITMYYREHNPPHFHVKYNEYKAIFTIEDLKINSKYNIIIKYYLQNNVIIISL